MDRRSLSGYIQDAERIAKEVFAEIHSWPELGKEEVKTAGVISKRLNEMGLVVEHPAATAVVTEIRGKKASSAGPHNGRKRTIALRAEMDALPIAEEAMISCRSRRAGIMHACGHDAHMAVLVGLARVLCRMQEELSGNVRLIFQPDEEGNGGAEELIAAGVLDGVEEIYGFHVKPELPAGTIGICHGTVHGESRIFRGRITGVTAHGAKPDLGRDAIYGAAQLISMCQSIVARNLPADKAGVITFGLVEGGQSRNILAGRVRLEGIVRGEDTWVCDLLCRHMRLLAQGIAQALGVTIELDFRQGCQALVNTEQLVEKVRQAAAKAGKVAELPYCSLTVDDFSAYLQHIPGAYFFLGCGFEGRKNSGLHTGSFQVNENCLKTGIAALAALCQARGK